MIQSILDQDLYTFTVGQAVIENFPEAEATYSFTSRRNVPLNEQFVTSLQQKILQLSKLQASFDEIEFVKNACRFIKPNYLSYLQNFQFDASQIEINYNPNLPLDLKDNFKLTVSGPWHSSIFWEVPILALVSEAYYETIDVNWNYDIQDEKIIEKGKILNANQIKFADFGTRRRRSFETQDIVVKNLCQFSNFVGTSNVYLAKKYNTKPIGTMSHQWIMGVSGLESLRYANRYALNLWNRVYQGDLGIALPDTFGTDAFFEDFDKQLARLFDGVRHDSNDPFEFAKKVVAHYNKLGINPLHKTIVFSDGLDAITAVKLQEFCRVIGIGCSFGIGTNFTNDFEGSPALNIVMKLRTIAKNRNSKPIDVVKLSDVPSKATGETTALRIAKHMFLGEEL